MPTTPEKLRRSAWVSSQMASLLELQVSSSKEIKPKDINSYNALRLRILRHKDKKFKIEEQSKLLKITRIN